MKPVLRVKKCDCINDSGIEFALDRWINLFNSNAKILQQGSRLMENDSVNFNANICNVC